MKKLKKWNKMRSWEAIRRPLRLGLFLLAFWWPCFSSSWVVVNGEGGRPIASFRLLRMALPRIRRKSFHCLKTGRRKLFHWTFCFLSRLLYLSWIPTRRRVGFCLLLSHSFPLPFNWKFILHQKFFSGTNLKTISPETEKLGLGRYAKLKF